MKVNDAVGWTWGNGIAQGIVTKICPERTEITTKGKKIVRNGTVDDPALIIQQESGTKVLKLQHEVQKTS